MSHYAADNDGHRLAVNRAVPLLYPELRKKYGDVVTYEDQPLAHVKAEFGFDVLEVAKQRRMLTMISLDSRSRNRSWTAHSRKPTD
jgi:hypothetical protein